MNLLFAKKVINSKKKDTVVTETNINDNVAESMDTNNDNDVDGSSPSPSSLVESTICLERKYMKQTKLFKYIKLYQLCLEASAQLAPTQTQTAASNESNDNYEECEDDPGTNANGDDSLDDFKSMCVSQKCMFQLSQLFGKHTKNENAPPMIRYLWESCTSTSHMNTSDNSKDSSTTQEQEQQQNQCYVFLSCLFLLKYETSDTCYALMEYVYDRIFHCNAAKNQAFNKFIQQGAQAYITYHYHHLNITPDDANNTTTTNEQEQPFVKEAMETEWDKFLPDPKTILSLIDPLTKTKLTQLDHPTGSSSSIAVASSSSTTTSSSMGDIDASNPNVNSADAIQISPVQLCIEQIIESINEEDEDNFIGGAALTKKQKIDEYLNALSIIQNMVVDYLDTHKVNAIQSSLIQPARFYLNHCNNIQARDDVQIHGINGYLCLLRGYLDCEMPLVPNENDENAYKGFVDIWSGNALNNDAWEIFQKTTNFGKDYEFIKELQPDDSSLPDPASYIVNVSNGSNKAMQRFFFTGSTSSYIMNGFIIGNNSNKNTAKNIEVACRRKVNDPATNNSDTNTNDNTIVNNKNVNNFINNITSNNKKLLNNITTNNKFINTIATNNTKFINNIKTNNSTLINNITTAISPTNNNDNTAASAVSPTSATVNNNTNNRSGRMKYEKCVEKFGHFFSKDFLVKEMFERLNNEQKLEYIGFKKACSILYPLFKNDLIVPLRQQQGQIDELEQVLPALAEEEDQLLSYLYNRENYELDIDKAAQFFAWCGILKPKYCTLPNSNTNESIKDAVETNMFDSKDNYYVDDDSDDENTCPICFEERLDEEMIQIPHFSSGTSSTNGSGGNVNGHKMCISCMETYTNKNECPFCKEDYIKDSVNELVVSINKAVTTKYNKQDENLFSELFEKWQIIEMQVYNYYDISYRYSNNSNNNNNNQEDNSDHDYYGSTNDVISSLFLQSRFHHRTRRTVRSNRQIFDIMNSISDDSTSYSDDIDEYYNNYNNNHKKKHTPKVIHRVVKLMISDPTFSGLLIDAVQEKSLWLRDTAGIIFRLYSLSNDIACSRYVLDYDEKILLRSAYKTIMYIGRNDALSTSLTCTSRFFSANHNMTEGHVFGALYTQAMVAYVCAIQHEQHEQQKQIKSNEKEKEEQEQNSKESEKEDQQELKPHHRSPQHQKNINNITYMVKIVKEVAMIVIDAVDNVEDPQEKFQLINRIKERIILQYKNMVTENLWGGVTKDPIHDTLCY